MLQFVKSARQLYLSIKQLQFNKEIMRQSYEIKRKAVIFFEKGGSHLLLRAEGQKVSLPLMNKARSFRKI
mgnify:FL=1